MLDYASLIQPTILLQIKYCQTRAFGATEISSLLSHLESYNMRQVTPPTSRGQDLTQQVIIIFTGIRKIS